MVPEGRLSHAEGALFGVVLPPHELLAHHPPATRDPLPAKQLTQFFLNSSHFLANQSNSVH